MLFRSDTRLDSDRSDKKETRCNSSDLITEHQRQKIMMPDRLKPSVQTVAPGRKKSLRCLQSVKSDCESKLGNISRPVEINDYFSPKWCLQILLCLTNNPKHKKLFINCHN